MNDTGHIATITSTLLVSSATGMMNIAFRTVAQNAARLRVSSERRLSLKPNERIGVMKQIMNWRA
jgi:hypothetical protein